MNGIKTLQKQLLSGFKMQLQVTSNQCNMTAWILAGFNRRVNTMDDVTDEICLDVAKELRLDFERENDILTFKDITYDRCN